VVVADDDFLLREGLASLVERSGFVVVGQAGDGVELVTLVRATNPDLAIIDIRMPPAHATEGLQAARVIRQELPDTAIIVLSAHVEVDEAMDLLAGGERVGYLLKSGTASLQHDRAQVLPAKHPSAPDGKTLNCPTPVCDPGDRIVALVTADARQVNPK
jgi:serine/threonine-protein kinase PknK